MPRSRLQLEVEVLWVEVVNPDVSVLSSAAVTASATNAAPGSVLAKVLAGQKRLRRNLRDDLLAVRAPTSCRRGGMRRS